MLGLNQMFEVSKTFKHLVLLQMSVVCVNEPAVHSMFPALRCPGLFSVNVCRMLLLLK